MKIFYLFLSSLLFLSCNQDDESVSTIPISENDVLGRWSVSYVEQGNTVDLKGYVFEFKTNNLLTITKEAYEIDGDWEIISVNTVQKVKILIPTKDNPLRVVHDDWGIDEVSANTIYLSEINRENGFLKSVHFTKL